jgi:hypothetical protein
MPIARSTYSQIAMSAEDPLADSVSECETDQSDCNLQHDVWPLDMAVLGVGFQDSAKPLGKGERSESTESNESNGWRARNVLERGLALRC